MLLEKFTYWFPWTSNWVWKSPSKVIVSLLTSECLIEKPPNWLPWLTNPPGRLFPSVSSDKADAVNS